MNTYAFANRASLPGNASTLDTAQPSKTIFASKAAKTEQARPSTMVAKDRPHPAPKPSPDIAHDVDRETFAQRWADEARAARKAAFIQERTDPRSGGQVRVFNRQADRNR